jgi:hypothetical protein
MVKRPSGALAAGVVLVALLLWASPANAQNQGAMGGKGGVGGLITIQFYSPSSIGASGGGGFGGNLGGGDFGVNGGFGQ